MSKRVYEQLPDVVFVVVGSDRVCYGGEAATLGGKSFRQHVLESDDYDLSRFRFTGTVPERVLAAILSRSDLHVYLIVPFVPSWSLLNAMSCGCVVLASDQACVREYITHGQNGLLCDFFDYEAQARRVVEVLADPSAYVHLGEAARRMIEEKYSLSVTLPRIKAFFEEVAARPRRPSWRADLLTRPDEPPPPLAVAPSAAEAAAGGG